MKMAWDWARYFLGVTTFGGAIFGRVTAFGIHSKETNFFTLLLGAATFRGSLLGAYNLSE